MRLNATDRRRVVGAVFLSVAVLMLVAGQPLLAGVNDLWKLAYWFFCFLFTVLAMMIALVDLRAIRRSTREEQRDLMHGMINDIADDSREGSRPGEGRKEH